MRITEIEKQIEKQKLYLSDLSLFDPYASFTRIDRDNKGYLEAKDIFKFLSEMYPNEVYLSWRSPYREARADQEINASFGIQNLSSLKGNLCRALINFFDIDNDGRLGYSDYLQLILPMKSTISSKSISKKEAVVKSYEYLPYEVESELARLLELELNYQDEFERCKQDQEKQSSFSVLKTFKALDPHDFGYIDIQLLKEMLGKGKDPIIAKTAIKAMIRRINMNRANKITFSEFALMLTPVNPFQKLDNAPKFIEYSPRRETLAENSSPKFNKSLYKNKVPEIPIPSEPKRLSRPLTSRTVNKIDFNIKKHLNQSCKKGNLLNKGKSKTRNMKSANTFTAKKTEMNEKKPKIKKECHKVTPLRRSPDKKFRLSHEMTTRSESKRKYNSKSYIKKQDAVPSTKETDKNNAKTHSKIIMMEKRNISSKLASKNSKYLTKTLKAKKKTKSKKSKLDDLKQNKNEVENRPPNLVKDDTQTKSTGKLEKDTKIEPYHSVENSKNEIKNEVENNCSYPLRTTNSAKNLGVDKSKYLTSKNAPINEDPSSYLKKVSFADENLRSYRDYNTYQSPQYYPQRYYPRPPLPARNEYERSPPANYSNHSSAISCSPHRISPLRHSMMHLPDRPLVNPALLTTSPIRYYPDIPRNYPQRKPYVSQTFTKPSNATFSTKNETIDSEVHSDSDLERNLVKLAKTADFNLIDGFRIFDLNGKGTIIPADLKNGLETLGLFIENEDILAFSNKYDNDHDGKVKYSDFCDAFIPKDEAAAEVLKDKSPYNIYTNDSRDRYFSPQTRALFRQAFKSHFDCLRVNKG